MIAHELESQMYHDMLVRETRLSVLVLNARIELFEMEAEIESYRKSSGETQGYILAKKRFDKLWDAIHHASSLDDEAYVQRLLTEKYQRENILLRKKIADLEAQIDASAKAWNKL